MVCVLWSTQTLEGSHADMYISAAQQQCLHVFLMVEWLPHTAANILSRGGLDPYNFGGALMAFVATPFASK